MEQQTDETIDEFWQEYAGAEKRIYQDILKNYPEKLSGKLSELAEKYEARPVIFMGFMDGINSSLKEEKDLDLVTEDSDLEFDIDYEKLYFNMFDHLFNALYVPEPEEKEYIPLI